MRSKQQLARGIRQNRKERQLGTRSPKCVRCNETNALALTRYDKTIICYEDLQKIKGRKVMEKHHPSGKHNDSATVAIPGNDHRILSDRQSDWPEDTLRNPRKSPLIKAAAAIRGWLDVMDLLVARLAWIAPFLEKVDRYLCEVINPVWWKLLDSHMPKRPDPDAWKKD
jgi:hypothetical protein